MWTLFLVAGLFTGQAQQGTTATAGAVQTPQEAQARVSVMMANRADPLELTLASPVQLPNGRRLGGSVRPAAGPDPWFVYSRGNICQSIITHGPAPVDATEGWKVTVIERSRAATQVMVGVTWSRMWERGRAAPTASGGTSELTLQRGDRISLDTITRVSDPAVCAGTAKSLELQVGVANVNVPVPAGDSPLDGIVDTELWMVHKAPNGTETVEHQVVRLINGTIGFSFRGGPVDTTDGPIALELSGQLKAVRQEDGSRGLWASLTRGITRLATGATSVTSPTSATVKWLTPGEVQEFELPALTFYPTRAMSGARGVGGGGGGGGGRGGAVGGLSTSPPPTGSQAAGGGVAAGGIVRGSGGSGAPMPPNLLEGHRLSLRVRLNETR